METRDLTPSLQGLVSQDDGGLWMKTDSNPVTAHTDSPLVTCGEKPQDEAKCTLPASEPSTRYYSVMDDEGADDIFIPPPPPSYMAPLLPAEGSTHAMVSNPSVTLTNWAADATEAKANPSGLDWHRGEKQLMAAHSKVDEVKASTEKTSEESMHTRYLSKRKDSTEPKDQGQTSMEGKGSLMEKCYDPCGRYRPGNTAGDEEPNAEPQDVEDVLSGGQENWKETKAERDKYPKQLPSNIGENSENETHFDKDGDKTTSEDICGPAETDSKLTTQNSDGVETNTPTLSSLGVNNEDFESLCTSRSTNQPQVSEVPIDVSSDDEENVDTRSLDYNLTKYHWVRRESGASEAQVPQLPIFQGSEEMATKQGDGSRKIATDIQQGEQLLQRLQQVQLRQDEHTPESPQTSQQDVQETKGENKSVLGTEVEDLKAREGNPTSGDEREESRSHTVDDDEEGKISLIEGEKDEGNDVETKAKMSPTLSVEPEHHMIARTESVDSDNDQNDNWVPSDLSPINAHETSSTQISFPSTWHQFSAVETTIERQIHEAAKVKQNLQRASGLFNLAENPDVLEIPFKSNISLEPLTITVSQPCQRSDWQFSEQKMQKEISQEIQRELVLVNLGKIPGGYSKGEIRQLKETKLLFEAFQQDNMEGPTRHRKSPTSLKKGHFYPTVLERTRSLEMFSQKSRPVSRAQSFRLNRSTSEMEKSPEGLRSRSPISYQDKKHLLPPSPKQDKNMCLYRSMDSLSTNTSVMETGKNTRKGNMTQESPILKQNPFYKLRPALALQPEVEKDIRESKERDEELRRQRCTLYGENRRDTEDGEKSEFTPTPEPDIRRQSRGKLERVWPPPSKKDQTKSVQTQEPKVHRAGGQKSPLWQRWESGLVNGQSSEEKN